MRRRALILVSLGLLLVVAGLTVRSTPAVACSCAQRTAQSSASCGLGIDTLGPYVIFAAGNGTRFEANLCDGSVDGTVPTSFGGGSTPLATPSADVTPRPPTAAEPVPPESLLLWSGLGVLALVGAVIGTLVIRQRRRLRVDG